MILFDYCRSSTAYRVRIALNLKGMDYQQVPVNLVSGEQRGKDHLARNPQGLVPVLEDQGVQISQSLAICEYLDETYPQDDMTFMPDDSLGRARVRSLSQLIACDIHPVDNLRVLKRLVGELGASEEQKLDWYRHWVYEGFDALEMRLASDSQTGIYCHGDQISLADICLVPQVFNARRFNCDMSRYPTISRINDELLKVAAIAKAHPDLQPGG
ncbi:MAG: maleylacetoacetate isomerase [Marinobacterium sp.]|nr:maleylacetoacetate isomerase [Marinobacterium sp.]